MWTIVLVLIGVGLLMVLLEILVIPGGGLPGIIGFGLMVTGVYLSFTRIGNTEGVIVLVVTIIINVLALVFALRSNTWDRAMLKTNINGKVNTIDEQIIKVGDTGLTISRCAPLGKALINDEYYEVNARTEFVNENTEIVIVKIEGNKILIKPKN